MKNSFKILKLIIMHVAKISLFKNMMKRGREYESSNGEEKVIYLYLLKSTYISIT